MGDVRARTTSMDVRVVARGPSSEIKMMEHLSTGLLLLIDEGRIALFMKGLRLRGIAIIRYY